MNKNKFIVGIIAFGALAAVFAGSLEVSGHTVRIHSNLLVSPNIISFETVFPGEVELEPLTISLAKSFQDYYHYLGDVEYEIIQKPKPRANHFWARAYCAKFPNDVRFCYPSLCPYLSKEPDGSPPNDTGVPAFHNPSASSSIARGKLSKSNNDVEDTWTIDLHTPCFKGQCDQSGDTPPGYALDPSLDGEKFACDLAVQITRVGWPKK